METRKSAFITGGTGYIGVHLTNVLIDSGWNVTVLAREKSKIPPKWKSLKQIEVYYYSPDNFCIADAMKKSSPDIVFHLAAFASENTSKDVENKMVEANYLFPLKIIETMCTLGFKKIINTESYWQYIDDQQGFTANSFYAATKQSFKNMLNYFAQEGSIQCISLVLYDVFGPNDYRKKIINSLKDYKDKDEFFKMTEGTQKVSMVHINDVTDAYMIAANRLLNQFDNSKIETFFLPAKEIYFLKDLISRVINKYKLKINIEWGAIQHNRRVVMEPWIGDILPSWQPKISPIDSIGEILSE